MGSTGRRSTNANASGQPTAPRLASDLRARYKESAAPELGRPVVAAAESASPLRARPCGAPADPQEQGSDLGVCWKYLEAGLVIRNTLKKDVGGWNSTGVRKRRAVMHASFAWHSPGAIAWRKRVGELGAALGVPDMDGIRRKLGPKWAYRLREAITLAIEDDWQRVLQSLGTVQKESPRDRHTLTLLG